MAEFFGRNQTKEYNNMVDDPYLNFRSKPNRPAKKRNYPFNASGYSNCCGLNATGDEILPEENEPVSNSVMKMQAWQYAKTGLAIVGAYVIIKYLYDKFIKK